MSGQNEANELSLTRHSSPSPRSTVGATREDTRALQPSLSRHLSTIACKFLHPLASIKLPGRFLAGLPCFLFPSTLPISTFDISEVFLCRTACPTYLNLLLFISEDKILLCAILTECFHWSFCQSNSLSKVCDKTTTQRHQFCLLHLISRSMLHCHTS